MTLKPVDYHLHSRFSVDSEAEPLALAQRAVALGYGEVGFAEHVDFDPDVGDYGYYDDGAYTQAVEELRAQFAAPADVAPPSSSRRRAEAAMATARRRRATGAKSTGLTILKGIEVDFQERYVEVISRFLSERRFDYRIGSVHYLDGHFIDEAGFAARSLVETYRIYCRETRALIASEMFDILGHLDYIRRRAVGRFQPDEVEGFAPMMTELAVEAARAGLLLEVNVQRDRVPLPTVDSLRAYLEAGGPGVVVGTDSHSLEQFEGGWERTRAYLAQAGVTEVVLFADRQRRLEPL